MTNMITWSVHGADTSATLASAVYLTELRNWAAQLDDALPIFFDTSPWEDLVPAAQVADLIAELETLQAKADPQTGAPADALAIINAMLQVARAALAAGRDIEIE